MKVPAAKRWEEIVQLLETEGYVEAKDLAKRYQISMETVRKDLTFLAEMGIAKKEYGGAWLSFVNAEKNIEWRNNHYQEKRAIARFAVSMLKDQHMLILDAGSTCQCCTSFINRISPMDIVTNSIGAFEQLSGKRHQVFLTGGKKREKNRSIIGNWTETFFSQVHADVCFLGTSGIMASSGPTAHSYQELTTKQKMVENSDLAFVLADSTKFQEKGFHTVVNWDQIDGIITDDHLSRKLYEEYDKIVPIYLAKEDHDEEDC